MREMFNIFNKKEKVVLDFFTNSHIAHDYVPITKSTENYPEWWKTLPKKNKIKNFDDAIRMVQAYQSQQPVKNMKTCWGFTELYKRGLTIRNWCDLFIQSDAEKVEFVYSSGDAPTSHHKSEYNDAFENFHHVKLLSPWLVKEKQGIPFMVVGDTYNNHNLNLQICPGILQFNMSASTNIQIFVPKNEKVLIPIGKPLIHLISLRDDLDVDFRCHLVNDEEFKKINSKGAASLFGQYGIQKFLKYKKENKCPFH